MKLTIFRSLSLFLILLCLNSIAQAQLHYGISDVSVAATNTQWGIPFLQFAPVHPGIELGATFIKLVREKSSHSLQAKAGYFYHDIMASAPYVKAEYIYQPRIKRIIGIDLGAGAGYLHAFYPGEAYRFDEDTEVFESVLSSEPFFAFHATAGLSYVGWEKVQPFVRYDMMMLNNFYNQAALLKLGVKVNL